MKKILIGLVIAVIAVPALLYGALMGYTAWLEANGDNPDFFEDAITAFEAQDAQAMPPEGSILFIGSSSIRFWSSMEQDFAPLPVINRGFGGAHIFHVISNFDRLVPKYEPAAIVFFCGTNDLSAGKSLERVLSDFDKFTAMVKASLPGTPIVVISYKPSPARWDGREQGIAFSNAQKARADRDPDMHFVNITQDMLGPDGMPRDELFIFDKLHINEKGYAIWTKRLKPVLEDILKAQAG